MARKPSNERCLSSRCEVIIPSGAPALCLRGSVRAEPAYRLIVLFEKGYLRLVFPQRRTSRVIGGIAARPSREGRILEGFESAVLKTEFIIRHNLIKDYAFFITIILQKRGVPIGSIPLWTLRSDGVSRFRSVPHGHKRLGECKMLATVSAELFTTLIHQLYCLA